MFKKTDVFLNMTLHSGPFLTNHPRDTPLCLIIDNLDPIAKFRTNSHIP